MDKRSPGSLRGWEKEKGSAKKTASQPAAETHHQTSNSLGHLLLTFIQLYDVDQYAALCGTSILDTSARDYKSTLAPFHLEPCHQEMISRRRARLEDHLTKCKPISTRGEVGTLSQVPTNEEDDPAEFWGELLFFDHDRDAIGEKDQGGGGKATVMDGGGEQSKQKVDKRTAAGHSTFDGVFSAAAERDAADVDLFDEETVDEMVIDMDAHPGFVKPEFDRDDCEPDCSDSEGGDGSGLLGRKHEAR